MIFLYSRATEPQAKNVCHQKAAIGEIITNTKYKIKNKDDKEQRTKNKGKRKNEKAARETISHSPNIPFTHNQ